MYQAQHLGIADAEHIRIAKRIDVEDLDRLEMVRLANK